MAGISDLLGGDNLQQLVSGLSEKTGISADKVSTVVDSLKSMLGNADSSDILNKLTGEFELGERTGDNVVGYIAYFKLINGFEKYLYN